MLLEEVIELLSPALPISARKLEIPGIFSVSCISKETCDESVYNITAESSYRYEKPKIPLKRHGVIDLGDGYLYRNYKKLPGKMYLKCAMIKEVSCKSSYVLHLNDGENGTYRCLTNHNHPPNQLTLQSSRFLAELEQAVQFMPGSTKKIFDQIIEGYPEVKAVYTYSNVVGRMHHWLKKYNIHSKASRRITKDADLSAKNTDGKGMPIRSATYYGGYTYGMYSGNTASKVYLRCSGYKSTGCRGKGYMLKDKGIESFVLLSEHSHPPNFLMEKRSEIAKTLKEFAATIPGRPIEVYNSVVSIYPEIEQLWPFSRAVRTINRIRQKTGFMRTA